MKIRFKKKVGSMEFEIEQEASTQAGIFDVVEFWSSLPSTAPGGATDLRFAHRVAQDYDFFEIVSDQEKKRFCFGQRKGEAHKGELFPKGWEDVFQGEGGYQDHDRQPEVRQQPAQQRPTEQRQAEGDKQNLDTQIRAEFKRLGIENAGQEKTIIKQVLNSRIGLLLAECQSTEKEDLLAGLKRLTVQERRSA